MPHPYKRADRVGEVIQEEISRILLREVKDPRLRSVTITAVRVSDDLQHAKVYFVPAASGSSPEETLKGLKSAAGFLRGELGRRLTLRYTPVLLFIPDDSLDRSLHIAALLKQVAAAGETRE